MMENVVVFLLVIFAGVLMAALCFVVGAWVMFKGKAGPGEGFVRTPKGKVYTVPDEGAEDFPEEGASVIAERSKKFLDGLLGGIK
jgi:hypothetical protein